MSSPRRPLALAVLAAATLCAAGEGARGDAPVPPAVVPNEPYPAPFRDKVNAAVAKGVAALRSTQAKDGSWESWSNDFPLGVTSLALLALLKAGVPSEDPTVVKGFTYLAGKRPGLRTYDVGLFLMALAARYGPTDDPFGVEEVDAQGKRVTKWVDAERIPRPDREAMQEGVDFLLKYVAGGGLWGYPGTTADTQVGPKFQASDVTGDLSNTQFALLGLKAASRCGVAVPPAAWKTALEGLLARQAKKGREATLKANEVRGASRIEWTESATCRGFGYYDGDIEVTGSMTVVGAAGLLICQSELLEPAALDDATRVRTREAIRDALAWLQVNFAVAKNPGKSATVWTYLLNYLYYLYGLERLGDLAHVRFVGTHDWYLSGAQVLLERQRADGIWGQITVPVNMDGFVDTCFALLFLRRGTARVANPAITPADPVPATGTAPPSGK